MGQFDATQLVSIKCWVISSYCPPLFSVWWSLETSLNVTALALILSFHLYLLCCSSLLMTCFVLLFALILGEFYEPFDWHWTNMFILSLDISDHQTRHEHVVILYMRLCACYGNGFLKWYNAPDIYSSISLRLRHKGTYSAKFILIKTIAKVNFKCFGNESHGRWNFVLVNLIII